MPLKAKVGVITGAGSGIGKAIAKHFATLGARIYLLDLDPTSGQATAEELNQKGHFVTFFHADVSKEEDHLRVLETIISNEGKIDFAINNAGIEQRPSRLTDIDEKTWQRLIDVNTKGVWLGMKHQIRQMQSQGFGSIVNTGSVAGVTAIVDIGVYNAAKAAVIMLTRSAALENASSGIRINCVSPGLIETEMALRMKQEHPAYYQTQLVDVIPMKRAGHPDEIAKAVAFLASSDSSFITGHNLIVDGGFLA